MRKLLWLSLCHQGLRVVVAVQKQRLVVSCNSIVTLNAIISRM